MWKLIMALALAGLVPSCQKESETSNDSDIASWVTRDSEGNYIYLLTYTDFLDGRYGFDNQQLGKTPKAPLKPGLFQQLMNIFRAGDGIANEREKEEAEMTEFERYLAEFGQCLYYLKSDRYLGTDLSSYVGQSIPLVSLHEDYDPLTTQNHYLPLDQIHRTVVKKQLLNGLFHNDVPVVASVMGTIVGVLAVPYIYEMITGSWQNSGYDAIMELVKNANNNRTDVDWGNLRDLESKGIKLFGLYSKALSQKAANNDRVVTVDSLPGKPGTKISHWIDETTKPVGNMMEACGKNKVTGWMCIAITFASASAAAGAGGFAGNAVNGWLQRSQRLATSSDVFAERFARLDTLPDTAHINFPQAERLQDLMVKELYRMDQRSPRSKHKTRVCPTVPELTRIYVDKQGNFKNLNRSL